MPLPKVPVSPLVSTPVHGWIYRRDGCLAVSRDDECSLETVTWAPKVCSGREFGLNPMGLNSDAVGDTIRPKDTFT